MQTTSTASGFALAPSVSISVYGAFANNPIFNRDPLGDTSVPSAPVGFAQEGGSGGYLIKKEINLSYKSSSRVFKAIDILGDHFLIKETSELADGYGGKQWKTSRSYWSERPQAKGSEYAADAHWVPYLDEGQSAIEQSKQVSNILIATPFVAATTAFTAPIIIESGLIQYSGNLLRSGLQYGYRKYGRNFAINTAKQFFSNEGDVSKIDWFDIGISTLNPFKKAGIGSNFLNEATNSLVDYKTSGFKVVLYNKNASNVIIDLTLGQIKATSKASFNQLGGNNESRDFFFDIGLGIYKSEAKKLFSK